MSEISVEEQIAEVVEETVQEMKEWEKIGVLPHQVIQINTLLLDENVHSLAQFLIEKELIDADELALFQKKSLLERLKMHREDLTPLIQAERRKQMGIETAFAIPGNLKKIH